MKFANEVGKYKVTERGRIRITVRIRVRIKVLVTVLKLALGLGLGLGFGGALCTVYSKTLCRMHGMYYMHSVVYIILVIVITTVIIVSIFLKRQVAKQQERCWRCQPVIW